MHDTKTRWAVCFLVLPALWLALSLFTGVYAVIMIPAAVVAALVSALIGRAGDRGRLAMLGYFLGTGGMMAAAFALFVILLFTVTCWGVPEGSCDP